MKMLLSGEEASSKETGSALILCRPEASSFPFARLEWKGVLLSWAVPMGPSLDPSVKRLAMKVEDHPIEYAKFEGVIPEGECGGGAIMLWDIGTWEPEQDDVDEALRKGDFKFTLYGQKLKGSWVLVRTRGYGSSAGRSSWLLIKHRDRFASSEDVTETKPYSVSTRRLLADIARAGGGDVGKAATGDPVGRSRVSLANWYGVNVQFNVTLSHRSKTTIRQPHEGLEAAGGNTG